MNYQKFNVFHMFDAAELPINTLKNNDSQNLSKFKILRIC